MAELNTSAKTGNAKGRTRRPMPRVDLTAMVDLAFLLITFFILTTTLQKPRSMKLTMPDSGPTTGEVSEKRTMTVVLGANDKLTWYMGQPQKPLTTPKVENYDGKGIRQVLMEQSQKIRREQGKEMMVLIKPSDQSNYKNLVAIMDELNIINNDMRAIVKISPDDIAMLKRDNIYN